MHAKRIGIVFLVRERDQEVMFLSLIKNNIIFTHDKAILRRLDIDLDLHMSSILIGNINTVCEISLIWSFVKF